MGRFAFFVFDEFNFGVDVFREKECFGFGIDFEVALAGCFCDELFAFQPDIQDKIRAQLVVADVAGKNIRRDFDFLRSVGKTTFSL